MFLENPFMEDLLNETFHFHLDTYATLIDLRVIIECTGQRTYSGRVYTVDPVTQRSERSVKFFFFSRNLLRFSIVLIDESSNRVQIVLRPDIIQLKIVDRSLPPMVDPFLSSNVESTNADPSMVDRLEKLRSYLTSKRIPFGEKVEENHSITLLIQNGIVQINSPYTHQTISGTNEIVLSRMKFLLKQIL